jgi:hypothetical protein
MSPGETRTMSRKEAAGGGLLKAAPGAIAIERARLLG